MGKKPSLFYQPQMSVSDYIATEVELFKNRFYNSDENSINRVALSPVVELLIRNREGELSENNLNDELGRLKQYDVRRDYEDYFYRQSVNQQYSLSVSGGSNKYKVSMSAGHDRQLATLNKSDNVRSSFNLNNTLQLIENKLSLSSSIYYSESDHSANGIERLLFNNNPIYPYARVADNTMALPVIRNIQTNFIEESENKGLQDWRYYPLKELELNSNQTNNTSYRLQGDLNYQIVKNIALSALYQYGGENITTENLNRKESFFARDLINRFTQIDARGAVSYKLPFGDIFDQNRVTVNTHFVRAQINYEKNWGKGNELKGIAGTEIRSRLYKGANNRHYGFNADYASTSLIDYVSLYPSYITGFNMAIPFVDRYSEQRDHNVSYYGNAAYSFSNKYLVSVTARLDKSNLFGVETNQKGVPLYSVGGSWELSKERFYNLTSVPYARLRITWGYNGNMDKKVSALTTARYGFIDYDTQIPYSQILNPPNPQLRWEKVGILNTALDFATINRRVSGTIEFYHKNGVDLIGDLPTPPSVGVSSFRGNYAETKGSGIDFSLHTQNLNGALKWTTDVIISHARDRVVKYDVKATALSYAGGGDNSSSGILPMEGRPLLSVYSFRYKGLDSKTGSPIGYLNGEESQNYTAIISGTTPDDLIFHGSARPTWFGSIRNSLEYRKFSLSTMITYRGGYYFRNNSIRYGTNRGLSSMHGDYANRWQKTGDESFTKVPSVPNSTDFARDNLYMYGETLVQKGDHVRFKDVEISYNIGKDRFKNLFIQNLRVYTYFDNIGLLWKASKGHLDPDHAYSAFPPVKTYSIGIKADL